MVLKNQDIYLGILSEVDKIGRKLGLDYYLRDITKPMTISLYFNIFQDIVGILFTMISMYTSRDNPLEMIFAFSTIGVIFTISNKTLLAITMNYCVHQIIAETKNQFARLNVDAEKAEWQKNGLEYFQKVYKYLFWCYLGSPVFMFICTISASIYNNEKYLVLGYAIPFVDPQRSPGYEINFLFQASQCYVAVTTVIMFDVFYLGHMLIECHHFMAMIEYFHDLDRLANESGEVRDLEAADRILISVINEFQSHIRIMRLLDIFTSFHNLCAIAALMIALILTLFVLIKILWIPGIVLCVTMIFNLLFHTAIGTVYITFAERFEKAVYNCQWYNFPARIQRMFIILLALAQRPIQPSAGGFAAMDLRTFLQCMKTTYTVLMMLLNRS
ncbi:odorant receptor Or2-like [Phlebotomus argentipes]|uniref:odorant receptor Or2-like n=1 Tax=Phlebotomus argentipes TaxID=94469 RepID=UPI002893650D|nr:odorant receptor Or2-like [Phlebotomus argentipes]